MPNKDLYSQIGFLTVTESAAATLTFSGITIATAIMQQNGMIIHRVEYEFSPATLAVLNSDQDVWQFGLSGSDNLTAISLNDAEVYDENRLVRMDLGTAGSGLYVNMPIVKDLSTLPGGGKLVPADRVYLFLKGTGTASAGIVNARIHFTIVDLDAAGYLELAQSLRVLK